MNRVTCEMLADRLPDWAADRIAGPEAAAISAHVQTCADCAAQAAVLRALVASRPAAPAGMNERIVLAMKQPSPGATTRWRRRPGAIAAAAVLVLAVGTAVMRRTPEPTEVTVASSALGDVVEDESVVWTLDDGAVAGAPVLEDLSDEALATLVEELGA